MAKGQARTRPARSGRGGRRIAGVVDAVGTPAAAAPKAAAPKADAPKVDAPVAAAQEAATPKVGTPAAAAQEALAGIVDVKQRLGVSEGGGPTSPEPGTQAKPGPTSPEPGAQAEPGPTSPEPGTQATPGPTSPEPGTQATPGQTSPEPGTQATPGQTSPEPGTQATPGPTSPEPGTQAKPGSQATTQPGEAAKAQTLGQQLAEARKTRMALAKRLPELLAQAQATTDPSAKAEIQRRIKAARSADRAFRIYEQVLVNTIKRRRASQSSGTGAQKPTTTPQPAAPEGPSQPTEAPESAASRWFGRAMRYGGAATAGAVAGALAGGAGGPQQPQPIPPPFTEQEKQRTEFWNQLDQSQAVRSALLESILQQQLEALYRYNAGLHSGLQPRDMQ